MSCCGGSCGCGSSCQCTKGCNGCGMYPNLGSSETVIVGFTQVKTAGFEEAAEMSFGAENGCKCGSNCSCTNCNCC